MPLTTYLFLTYLIPLLCGQLDATPSVTKTPSKSFLAATPVKTSQFSSRTVTFSDQHSDKVKLIVTLTAQSATFSTPNQTILNTMVDRRSNFTTPGISGILSKLSSEPSVTVTPTPTMVQPSIQFTAVINASQKLTINSTPKITEAIFSQQTSFTIVQMTNLASMSISKTVTSRLLVPRPSSSETRSSKTFSMPKVTPSLTSSPNGQLIPTASKLKPSTTSGIMVSPSFNASSLNVSSSPFVPTSIPTKLSSSHVILNHTTSLNMKLNQTTVTTVVPNLSSSYANLNRSSSSLFIPHKPSVEPMTNTSGSPTIHPTSAPNVVLTATSSTFKVNFTSYPDVSSIFVTSQSVPSMLHSTSTISFNYSSFDVSSTVAIVSGCSNVPSCITLQPSATTIQGSNGTVPSSSLTKIGSRNTSYFVSVMPSSTIALNTTSAVHHKPTNGTQDKEGTHTTLIIGLAVGLSVAVILVILAIVCYRRRRSSYHYNVFYDEQNIVMHPFDYSK